MKRIRIPMHRYGEPDFDQEYLEWGFHDPRTQIREAESILRIVDARQPIRILDLACGTGTHAIYWAEQGHQVTAIDLSNVFVAQAKNQAAEKGVEVKFRVCDLATLDYEHEFDVVTWIEQSFYDIEIVYRIYRALGDKGYFVFDARNPDHPRTQQRGSNWRTWREQDGIFYLERHEINEKTGEHEDVWITIDPQQEAITEKCGHSMPVSLEEKTEIVRRAGFAQVKLYTLESAIWTHGQEPYWLWIVGKK